MLREHNLTVNAAARRFGTSREALTKMSDGVSPALEFVERWARAIGEDVNHWRELAGYEPVVNGARWFLDEIDRIRQDTGADFQVSAEEIAFARESPEALKAYAQALRARAEARRQG